MATFQNQESKDFAFPPGRSEFVDMCTDMGVDMCMHEYSGMWIANLPCPCMCIPLVQAANMDKRMCTSPADPACRCQTTPQTVFGLQQHQHTNLPHLTHSPTRPPTAPTYPPTHHTNPTTTPAHNTQQWWQCGSGCCTFLGLILKRKWGCISRLFCCALLEITCKAEIFLLLHGESTILL